MTGIKRILRRLASRIGLLLFVIAANGCLQPSLNPLFSPEESVFEPGLVGVWVCEDETWTFAKQSNEDLDFRETYSITVRTDRSTGELAGWLGRLDNQLFVTFVLTSDHGVQNKFLARHLVGAYTFGRLNIEPGRLRVAMLSSGWVDRAEQAGLLSIGLRRSTPMSDVLLTAPPHDLQRFARAYADDDEVFDDQLELVRADASGSNSSPLTAGHCYSEK
jgi:hypothetical protein